MVIIMLTDFRENKALLIPFEKILWTLNTFINA